MNMKSLAVMAILLGGSSALFSAPADDRKIEAAIASTYNYHVVLDDHVKAKVDNGVVTLSGTVRDQDEKRLAADTVENVAGVTGVRNEIVVKSEHPERSDGWVAFKIRSRLLTKANVSATATSVSVKDGVVTLTGKADNLAQKELTEAYAKDIDGVKSVKNEMVVATTTDDAKAAKASRSDTSRSTMAETVDDASITAQVKYALLTNRATSALRTTVHTRDGVVTLHGEVKSDAEKSLVNKLAGDVRGVRSVKNEMTVASAEHVQNRN